MFRYLVVAAVFIFTGASAQAATYFFGTDDAECVGMLSPSDYYFYSCQARMRVYVSSGDDGTSTNTNGDLDIFRRGERIGGCFSCGMVMMTVLVHIIALLDP